ncbi:hypothetical protein N7471_012382 [Penicillium samsonianum]|uniref:uncharacterized protein n=1 Tax=Penicillium samsonianum TaxID=1882272 RepID=UPI00254925C0|nr:uncharacterized protein N7471_012382 [Penicillium samsonianum]KAJ6125065.1 hypothetical protein N7471_012382 [Penicillium samsonianum]
MEAVIFLSSVTFVIAVGAAIIKGVWTRKDTIMKEAHPFSRRRNCITIHGWGAEIRGGQDILSDGINHREQWWSISRHIASLRKQIQGPSIITRIRIRCPHISQPHLLPQLHWPQHPH